MNLEVTSKGRSSYRLCSSQTKKEEVKKEDEVGVVNGLVCLNFERNGVKSVYVGETGRRVADTVKEHM